jgi:hypothetical protein
MAVWARHEAASDAGYNTGHLSFHLFVSLRCFVLPTIPNLHFCSMVGIWYEQRYTPVKKRPGGMLILVTTTIGASFTNI